MIKFCIIGAGSAEFTRRIVGDVLRVPEFKRMHLALMDIDGERLQAARRIVAGLASQCKASPAITVHRERKPALAGADFVQTSIQVGGYKPATVADFAIPKKYGLRQTIGDTLGIGGIMRGLRTIPVLFAIAEDIAACCPRALWLQYVNPMAINMIALGRAHGGVRAVGLCHSVPGTVAMLARDLGEPPDSIQYRCAGINHMAFYTKLAKRRADGTEEDLYPRLRAHAARVVNGEAPSSRAPEIHGRQLAEKVRYEVLLRLGYFVTESSEHFAEYVPWFIKPRRPDLIKKYQIPLDEYPARCRAAERQWREAERAAGQEPPPPSNEYAAPIIRAMALGGVAEIYGNVPNRDGLIPNLPRETCVEVPCMVDRGGIAPRPAPPLPRQLAALMQTSINVQLLVVEAALSGRREHVYHAAMLDPLTAATLPPDDICEMTDELLAAHGDSMPPLG